MNQYLIGFAGVVAGFILLVFRDKVKNFTGNIGFAERYLGVGGTWTFYILLGIAFIIFGLMWGAGTFQSFFEEFLGDFF
ncbi:MAG: hypothetical protein ACD_13C00118G0001 [uncultured bacterium]|nr:MAG: hypothetical protein ACD_13C00118G0001 [uncultured bacterium]